MRDQRLAVADWTDSVLDGYLAERHGAGYVNYRSMRAFAPLLGYLARWVCCQLRRRWYWFRWRRCWNAIGDSLWSSAD